MANHSHIPGIPPAKERLDDVMENQVRMILVSHRDRFVRFGFDWFERFCKKFNVEIVVVKNEKLSPQEELVQKYEGKLKGDETVAQILQDRTPSHRKPKG